MNIVSWKIQSRYAKSQTKSNNGIYIFLFFGHAARHYNLCKNVCAIEQVWKMCCGDFKTTLFDYDATDNKRLLLVLRSLWLLLGSLRWSAYSAHWISNWLLLFSSALTIINIFSHLPLCFSSTCKFHILFIYYFRYGFSSLTLWTEYFPKKVTNSIKQNK